VLMLSVLSVIALLAWLGRRAPNAYG
jgi:hypothetical protein